MFLFFDTETTGLPLRYDAPASATQNWPRLVQLATLLTDGNGKVITAGDWIVRPQGYTIPPASSRIHRITHERAMREGVAIADVLAAFQQQMEKATTLVAHNMEFDERILGAEFYRLIFQDPLQNRQKICTMKHAKVVKYCAIPSSRPNTFKWPRLDELHQRLFGTGFAEAHNASVDISATAKCFFELQRKGVL